MSKKYEFTKEELVDFYDCVKYSTGFAIYDSLHHMEGITKYCEAQRKYFQKNLERSKNNMSQEMLKTVIKIETASLIRCLNNLLKEPDSK